MWFNMGNVRLYGSTSGYTELAPPAVAPDGVVSLPSGTGTLVTTADVAALLPSSVAQASAAGVTVSSAAYVTVGGGPSVTLTTGSTVLLILSVSQYPDSSVVGRYIYTSFAVSGATTIGAADGDAVHCRTLVVAASAENNVGASRATLITGLTPGSNTFTMQHRTQGGGTAQIISRQLIVIKIGQD